MVDTTHFRSALKSEFLRFIQTQKSRFPVGETVAVDLHCHDLNSNVPDERMGRMLRLPETWAPTRDVLATLKKNGTVPLTITNHNNARSCWDLLEQGVDVLPGAEFTCTMPDFGIGLHVLTYGFTPAEEEKLNTYRGNLYHFLEYTTERDLVTVLAHPLFCYNTKRITSVRYLEKLSLMFDNFEAVNGQRDAWQNLLVTAWLDSLTEERIEAIATRENLSPSLFSKRPFKKAMTGGSDCHMALFAGTAGTLCHIPDLARRRVSTPLSALVLESLKAGATAPFGPYISEERLTCAVLDYFCQATLHMKDPGLVRLLLHKGSSREKLVALGITNAMMELRRHRYTTRFLEAFHNALHGKRPGFLIRRKVNKHYRPLVEELDAIATARRSGAEAFDRTLRHSLPKMFNTLDGLLVGRVIGKLEAHKHAFRPAHGRPFDFIEKMEVPAYIRSLVGAADTATRGSDTYFDILDGLPFPALFSLVLGGAHFMSAQAMFKSRPLLDAVSETLGTLQHPKRVLWLTDTLYDKNGVSRTLGLVRDEVAARQLPVDFAVVSSKAVRETNVVALKPLAEFDAPYYNEQRIALPDVLELHQLFVEGGYDRIICSTEGPMAAMALYLKYAFSVPAYFYLHTDWLTFAKHTLAMDGRAVDRVRRVLRALYTCFDGIFVLNCEQQASTVRDFAIPKERVFRTDHWVKSTFRPRPVHRQQLIATVPDEAPLVLFAGRVSKEKGTGSLPAIMRRIQEKLRSARLLVCGDGPALSELREAVPDGIYLGWVDDEVLAKAFAVSDVMVFPSTFDTFGNVLVEANACGLPVVAYGVKGPKDIVTHGKNGFLADTPEEMADFALSVLRNPELKSHLSKGALECAATHQPGPILEDLLTHIGLSAQQTDDTAAPRQAATHIKAS